MSARPARPRALYLAVLALTVAAGLASRRFPAWQPDFVARYAGDTLWAAMVFWLLGLVAPRRSTGALAIGAAGFAYLVEFSQLWRADWIDSVRRSTLGALVLGEGFLWSDLACYSVGVASAAGLEIAWRRSRRDSEGATHGG